MTTKLFVVLVPVWIGIIGNLLISVFHVESIGAKLGPLRMWYFYRGGFWWIMGALWTAVAAWAVTNYVVGNVWPFA